MLIDVSKWNGDIKWDKVKSSGVDGVIIRCGISTKTKCQTDSKFVTNIEGALKAGLNVGLYYYSFAKTEAGATQEADYAMKLAKPYKDKLYYPLFIDVEEQETAKYSKTVVTAFCKRVEAEGYKAGIYASASWWRDNLKGVTGYTKWVAQWSSKQPSCDIWQYTEGGKVNGITGSVDMNKVIKYEPIPIPEPTPKGDTVMVELSVLKKGMKCFQVGTVQRILRERKYKYKGKLIEVDESFGDATEACVKEFQKLWGLSSDGIVGEKTWNKLLKG